MKTHLKQSFLMGAAGMLAAMAVMLTPVSSHAIPEVDFNIVAPTTGSISYAGSGGSLVGSAIEVDSLVGLDTALHNFVTATCVACVLDFSTGPLTGTTGDSWAFGGGLGSFITITGGLDFLDAPDVPTGTVLMSGSFGDATVLKIGTTFTIAGGSFFDTKHAAILGYYGFDPLAPFIGGFNISFNASAFPPDAFASSIVLSGDVVNWAVPEPGTILLLGSGLIGLASWRVRRTRV